MDLGGAKRLGEVDQVYVLVAGPDVLELHPGGPVELDGILYILALLPHELDLDTRLLYNLAHRRLVRKFISFYMTTRRKPHPQLAVVVQEHPPLPHHEDCDREVPTGGFRFHLLRVQQHSAGEPTRVYMSRNPHAARLHIRAWLCIEETRLDVKLV